MAVGSDTLVKTPEWRRHLKGVILAQTVSIFFVGFLLFFFTGLFSGEIDRRLFHTAGVLERQYPGSSSLLIPHFTGEVDVRAVESGHKLFSAYGYTHRGSLAKPLVSAVAAPLSLAAALILLLLFVLNLFVYLTFQGQLFHRLSELSDSVLSVLEGKSAFVTERHEEGVLDILFTRFNQMVKRLEGTAESLSREKVFLRDIISDISHQLKTPLASLVLYNDLLLSEEKMESRSRRKFLYICRAQLNRMEWLVISLLKLARLESGSIEFKRENIDLIEPLNKALINLEHLRGNRTVEILDERSRQISFTGDGDWLSEAFSNIIKNSYEHTEREGGVLRIILRDTSLFLRVFISDNGPGICEADRFRIFDRFYKGGSSLSMESVGIGLPLTKMIVEGQGGTIRYEKPSFILTFPY